MSKFSQNEVGLLKAMIHFAHLNRSEFYKYVETQGHAYLIKQMEENDHNELRRKVQDTLDPEMDK